MSVQRLLLAGVFEAKLKSRTGEGVALLWDTGQGLSPLWGVPCGSPLIKSLQITRRFKTPWTAERIPSGYVVKDATGQAPGPMPTKLRGADDG